MKIELYKISEVYQHRYYKVPKDLFESGRYKYALNSDAKLLYALLLDRMVLSKENGWVNERGEIYLIYTRDDLCEILGLCRNTMTKAFKQLSDSGLIFEKRQGRGLPNLIYIGKIQRDKTQNPSPEQSSSQAYPQYPHNPQPENISIPSDSQNLRIKKRKKCESRIPENTNQDSQNFTPNETDIIETDKNETDNSQSVSKSGNEQHRQTGAFTQSKNSELEELESIIQQCELHIFHDKNIRMMFQHALETMFLSEYIKVGTARFSQSMVRSRMYNLHGSIISYALDKMKTRTENIAEIKNSTNYIISTLWNCISEYHADTELDPGLNRYLNTS
ncbi:MAG: hypothetical protein FIA99_07200 [Ruminiclostridium sp.]|nr:hypothetical protein [Ruminiclostridium sp.]